VRCTFEPDFASFCYKYCGALHLRDVAFFATNIAVRCTFKPDFVFFATNITVRCT
jgi:menaquinone-dependent protoporphyrinogen IX oxidase